MSDDYKCCPTCGQVVLSAEQVKRLDAQRERDREELIAISTEAEKVMSAAHESEIDTENLLRKIRSGLE